MYTSTNYRTVLMYFFVLIRESNKSSCRKRQPESVYVEPSVYPSEIDVPDQQEPDNDVELTTNRANTLSHLFTGNRLPTPPVSYIDSQLYYEIAT